MLRLWLERRSLGIGLARVRCARKGNTERALSYSKKQKISWYPELEDFEVPNKIQPGEQSKGGGLDDPGYALRRQRELELHELERQHVATR